MLNVIRKKPAAPRNDIAATPQPYQQNADQGVRPANNDANGQQAYG